MGRERIDRTSNPLAAMMDEELAGLEVEDGGEAADEGVLTDAIPEADGGSERSGEGDARARGARAGGPVRRSGRRRGRPRGGRNSDPNMVPISAKIHRDVRFAVDRTLAEQSELQGRPVYMAEVIEKLLRFYVEQGDPYELLEDPR